MGTVPKYKPKSNGSAALWIPLIWMIYSAAKPISLWLGMAPDRTKDVAYLEGNPVDRNILSVLIVLSIYVLLKREIKWRQAFKNNAIIFVWYLYCAISIFWSDFYFVSLRRWIKEIGMFLSILIVLTEDDPVGSVKVLVKRFSYITITASVILIIFFPGIGVSGTFGSGLNYSGVSYNKNGLGRICLFSGLFIFYNLVSMRRTDRLVKDNKQFANQETYWIQYLFFAVIIYLLGILQSATSLGGFTIGILIYLAFGTGMVRRNIKHMGTFVAITLISGVVLQYTFDIVGMFVTHLGRDMTFTGRTILWKDLLTIQPDSWIGAGYNSFWLGDRLERMWELHYGVNESHNGYLNIYLELGLIGLSLLGAVLYIVYRNIRKELFNNFDYGRFKMAMFIVILLYNITEDTFGKLNLMWYALLLFGVDISRKSQTRYYDKVAASTVSS